MKITPEPKQSLTRNVPIDKIRATYLSSVDLHKRLYPAVEARGYRWGLFRGSPRCPVKAGVLRHVWLNGFHRGVEDRRKAKAAGEDTTP